MPFVGSKCFVEKKDAVELPEGTFFIHDLIGCEVFKDNLFFGELKDVYVLSSNDVFVINTKNGEEVLIPALKNFVIDINIESKKITLSNDVEFISDDEN